MKYIIYSIVNPIDSKAFYIGQTCNFDNRKNAHLSHCHNTDAKALIEDIKQYGIEPLFFTLCECEDYEADEREQYYIENFLATGHNLFNKKAGRPKKTGNSATKQMNVGMPLYLLEQLEEKGKIRQISFSGYVRTLIVNDLKDVPTMF